MLNEMFPYIREFLKNAFGEAIGIIVWRSRYPALIHGHHNYATTYDFPMHIKFIENWRSPEDKMEEWAGSNLPEYIKCAKELEAEGVAAICTKCAQREPCWKI